MMIQCNKQLLDEVEHDSENHRDQGLCYLPKLKAEADFPSRIVDYFNFFFAAADANEANDACL